MIEGTCPLCKAEIGTTADCQNCKKYHETLEAFRKPCLEDAIYIHMTPREPEKKPT